MTWFEILVVVVAIAVVVIVYRIRAVRIRDRWFWLKASFAAIAAAVGALVLTSNFYDDVLEWAQGDRGWVENGVIRALLVLVLAMLVGYWVWILVKSKSRDC